MPRRKHWWKSASKRRERSKTDQSETAVRSVGSPSNVSAGSPSNVVAGSPSNVVAGSPSSVGETIVLVIKLKQITRQISVSLNRRLLILNLLQQVIALTHRHNLIVFLDIFPDFAANYQSRDNKELSKRESVAFLPCKYSSIKWRALQNCYSTAWFEQLSIRNMFRQWGCMISSNKIIWTVMEWQ